MNDHLDSIRKGVILWLLHTLGGEANFLVLLAGLKRWGSPTGKAKLHLLATELETAGYLTVRTDRMPGLSTETRKYKLTPKAQDFLHGEIKDSDIERMED